MTSTNGYEMVAELMTSANGNEMVAFYENGNNRYKSYGYLHTGSDGYSDSNHGEKCLNGGFSETNETFAIIPGNSVSCMK